MITAGMITLNPPGADPTLRLCADNVLDVGAAFRARLARGVPGDPGATPGTRLMLNAGTAAVRDPDAPVLHRLRGLGAILAGLRRTAHGVRLRLDDLELTEGTTEDSAAVVAASTAPAPYDKDLRAAAELIAGRPVRLVVERDQQLPPAIALARAAGPVRLTGRFATAHWPVLRRVFPGAALVPAPRGLDWEVADAFTGVPAGVRWRERAADPAPPGRWAGRVALRDLASPELDRAAAVVLGLCAEPTAAIGRGGAVLAWSVLAAEVERLRERGVAVLAEVWLGAPGVDPVDAPAAVATIATLVDRIAGFRLFDWPVGWTAPEWGGRSVRLEPAGTDLARHAVVVDPATDRAALSAVLAEVARPLMRAGDLVPGRVAGAYLCRPVRPDGDTDPDVVPGAPGIAVNLRTGTITRAGVTA